MAKFRKLSAEELSSSRGPMSGERARVRDEYSGYLKGMRSGEGGELRLDDEKKITVKNRIKRAAEDMGLDIGFKRSTEDTVRFYVK